MKVAVRTQEMLQLSAEYKQLLVRKKNDPTTSVMSDLLGVRGPRHYNPKNMQTYLFGSATKGVLKGNQYDWICLVCPVCFELLEYLNNLSMVTFS